MTTTSAATRQLSDQNSQGTVLGAAITDKIGFYGKTAIVQPVGGGGEAHTPTAGSTTTLFVNTTWDGSTGASAYTVGDVVKALKLLGLLAV